MAIPSPIGVTRMAKKKQKYEDWEIEGKANVMIEAEQIKKDKPLLKLVTAELKKRKKAINEIV